MNFKKLLFSFLLSIAGISTLFAEEKILYGNQADNLIPGAVMLRYIDQSPLPNYVRFAPGNGIPFNQSLAWINERYKLSSDYGFQLLTNDNDQLGYTHFRYQQTYMGFPVEGSMYILHVRAGVVESMNGVIYSKINIGNAAMTEAVALQQALTKVGATKYKWEIPAMEAGLKAEQNNPAATFYPTGKLTVVKTNNTFQLCYAFNIYAHQPFGRTMEFVNATTGAVVYSKNLIHTANTPATAQTVYNGNQSIMTDSFAGGYRLRDATRGNGVNTYNSAQTTTYPTTDFTNATTTWNNVNANLDQYATDGHFGAEATYDFYSNIYGRNSLDNAGFALLSYMHYDVGFVNAFWDGQRMSYGDGDVLQSGSYTPLVTIDIGGHEITHGLTEHTCNLNYQDESGALNESFSDIAGVTIDYMNNPTTWNWLMGDGIGGTPFRSMQQPSIYGDPDAYGGNGWYIGTADNGGVHTNSGVQNHWYYILVMGDTASNFLGHAYSVAAQGFTKAHAIVYRNQTVYLTSTSNYADARFYSIQSAQDLFGGCSPEVKAVTDAWYAVNVGPAFVPFALSSFSGSPNVACTVPSTVVFNNLSVNVNTWMWDFGDGTNTTTVYSPTHTYTSAGNYTITLTIDGGTCGKDTTVAINYIQLNPAFSCVNMTNGTVATQTGCTGVFYDNGGPTANYGNSVTSTMTISPTSSSFVTLTFTSFNTEYTYDYLYIYDGPTTASTLIGTYSGSVLPNNGNPIVSTGPSITIKFVSDNGLNYSGYSANWQCSLIPTPPIADFTSDVTTTCNNVVHFYDISNQPSTWFWDFGDGTYSSIPSPTHYYMANGVYNVKLVVTNSLGADSITQSNYITIAAPLAPAVSGTTTICGNDSTLLSITSPLPGKKYRWYNTPIGGTSLFEGTAYNTGPLFSTTSYYTERVDTSATIHVGKTTNSGGGSNYTNSNDRYLVFDCTTACILKSVFVYSGAAKNRTIELRDNNGAVISSVVVYIPNGNSRVTLNMPIPVGTDLRLGLTVGGPNYDLYRNNAGASYPYTNGPISITGPPAGVGTAYYYFFYDWEIQTTPDCVSPRTATTVNVNGVAAVITAGGATNICTGDSVVLSVGSAAGTTYQWYNNGLPVGTNNNTYTATTSGAYSVDVTSGSCPTVTASSVTVTVNTPAVATATLTGNANFCNGSSTSLSAGTGTGYNYQWTNGGTNIFGATSATYTATASGSYAVIVSTTGCGSDTSVAITVTEYPATAANITPIGNAGTINVCGSANTTFTAALTGATASSYQWTDNSVSIGSATASTYTTNTSGNYAVIITDVNNCTATSNIVVLTVNPVPVASFTDQVVCCAGLVNFTDNSTGTITGATYNWNFGDGGTSTQQNPSHTYATTGLFSVREIVSNGACKDTFTKSVTVDITGIHEVNNALSFEVYPNPVDNELHIINNDLKVIHVELMNVLGAAIWHQTISNQKSTIVPVKNIPAGVYFVRATDSKGNSQARKIVINH